MRPVVLTENAAEALEVTEEAQFEVRPAPRGRALDQCVRDAFIRGVDRVIVAGARLEPEEIHRGLDRMEGSDAVVWLDTRPSPSWSSLWVATVGSHFPAHRVVALAMWRHAWDALGNRARSPTMRGLAIESAVRLHHLGLEVDSMSSQVSPGWSGAARLQVARGWAWGQLSSWFG